MIRQKSNVHKKASSSRKPKSKLAGKKLALKALPKRYKAQKSRSIQPIINIGKIWDEFKLRYPIEFRLSFIRPDDLLVCDFILDNLKLANEPVPRLIRKNPAKPATLIMELPPQGFGEEAFLDATGPEVATNPDGKEKFPESDKSGSVNSKNVVKGAEPHSALPFARIRMAGPSRIAFAMPKDETSLDLTADAVLDACRRWPMQLDVNAAPEPKTPWYERFNDRALFNQGWLLGMTKSSNWSQATDTLAGALGNTRLVRSLNEAAGRIGLHSAQALNTGRTRGLARELKNTLQSEITKLAKKYPQLKESATRDLALATLTLKSTQAFAANDLQNFDISAIEFLPFLPIIFSPHKPAANVTALELPYRVLLSPVPPSSWWHATQPVEHNGRTELWHTRLTQPSEGIGPDKTANVRALWSADYEITESEIVAIVNDNKPFRMSLDALDRQMLVKLMAGFNEKDVDGHTFVPHTARSQRMMLSALGALLDVEGNWNTLPEKVGLEQWRHLAAMGRDFYVRVVYRGYLMPFGHSASLIKVTERKFEYQDKTKKGRVAILRQRFFIVVREWTKEYSGTGHAYGGRNFPFKSVEVLTRVTPNLREPKLSKLSDPLNKIYASVPNRACFWPMLSASQDFVFQLAATDICGQRVTFSMPLLFVGVEANQNTTANKEIITRYDVEPAARRRSSLGNATVCYAPIKDGAEGDPRLPTDTITFDAAGVKGISLSKPQFYPEVETAEVGIAAIQRLLQKPDAVVAVTFPETYKQNGFSGANVGEVFLKTLQAYSLEFGDQVKNDTLGGLATPSMAIQGLSRIMGPAAAKMPVNPADIETALSKVINNTFDPADFFKGAKILGGVELASLLEVATSLVGADVPKLLSKQLPDKIEARFDWKTNINNSDPLGLFVPNPDGSQTVLDMHGIISAPVGNPTASTFNANASLVHFKVNLFGFIIIWFDELAFKSKSGSKPDVAVNMHPGDQAIEFGGPLEFVNKLRQIIPSNGFADPPSLSVTPSGISASYSLNLPSVGVGIFTLEHVSLGAGFSLPFDSKPANVRFNFAERQRPFSLTVSMLGGGGFFAICISTKGVDEIEAALEFGAAVAINLGVASGGVEIKAGVYFHWKSESVELAGYVRLHGELSVLGLISASLTFNLQLAYLKESHHSVLWGEATLTIEIEILFFSFDVSVKCRREFGGSDADPKFIDLIPDQPTWVKYCEAFADEEA